MPVEAGNAVVNDVMSKGLGVAETGVGERRQTESNALFHNRSDCLRVDNAACGSSYNSVQYETKCVIATQTCDT